MFPTPQPARRSVRRLTVLAAAATAVIATGCGISFSGGADASPRPTPSAGPSQAREAPGPAAKHRPHHPIANKKTTGVPDGAHLKRYSGPCTITHSRTIVGVDATRCGALLIDAPGVVIEDSLLPVIDATTDRQHSVTLRRSTVRGGHWQGGAVWGNHITANRVEVTGAQHSVHCAGHCRSRLLAARPVQPGRAELHNNAFISNGGNAMVVRHNTLACTPQVNSTDGGCTADVSLFGDFGPIRDVAGRGQPVRGERDRHQLLPLRGLQPGQAVRRQPDRHTRSSTTSSSAVTTASAGSGAP